MALFYEEWHTGARETILWLHGAGVSGWTWRPVVDRLAEYHHLVPDLPEHGKSHRERPFSRVKAAEQLARLIEQHAHYSRAHVVGVGLGAQVASELVARFPDRVGRAVLSGMPACASARAGALARAWDELKLRVFVALRHTRWVREATMRRQGIPEGYRAEVAADTRRLTPGAYRRLRRQEEQGLPLPENASSGVPTLVVVGEHEPPRIRQSADMLVERLPKACGAIARGLGPSWNLEDPERFAETVRAWLTDRPLPDGLDPLGP